MLVDCSCCYPKDVAAVYGRTRAHGRGVNGDERRHGNRRPNRISEVIEAKDRYSRVNSPVAGIGQRWPPGRNRKIRVRRDDVAALGSSPERLEASIAYKAADSMGLPADR